MKKYYKHSIKNIIQVKNIITIEYLELPTNYIFPSETHNFWELVYIDKGAILYFIDDTPTAMKSGDLFFLSPCQTHSIKGINNSSSNIFVICFDSPSPILNILKNYKACLKKDEKGILSKLLDEAEKTFSLPFRDKATYKEPLNLGGEQMIKLYLELFLITILRNLHSSKTKNSFFIVDNIAKEICNSVIQELEKNVYKRISVNEICDLIHYSKSYLSRIFKEQTGKTIITYYNELKISEAKRLIRETSYSMTKISDLLGFSDPRYFNLLFKNIVHMPPAQYKNSIQKN